MYNSSIRTGQTTGQTYVDWIKRFILNFDKRHSTELGAAEVEFFPTHLAVAGRVAASTQELPGHSAVSTTMIYTHVLNKGGRGVASPLDHL
jgi:integrase